MQITELRVKNFRNYQAARLHFGPGSNILHGDNAQGKSNALEAAALACTGRSPRAGAEAELIRWEEEVAHVYAAVDSPQRGQLELEVSLSRGGSKQFKVNGVAKNRAADLIGLAPLVLFTVEDLEVVRGEPAQRRRFLNNELGLVSKSYYWTLLQYHRVVEQRNRLLREARERGASLEPLPAWDEQLCALGGKLVNKRARFLHKLEETSGPAHANLCGTGCVLGLQYRPCLAGEQGEAGWQELSAAAAGERIREELAAHREEELARGMTMAGPQRDDFLVTVAGRELRVYGSQGEQRSAAVALRLGLVELLAQDWGERPLLLLDDVFSELDANRRRGLFAVLEGQQAVITCTDIATLPAEALAGAHRLLISGGQVVEEG